MLYRKKQESKAVSDILIRLVMDLQAAVTITRYSYQKCTKYLSCPSIKMFAKACLHNNIVRATCINSTENHLEQRNTKASLHHIYRISNCSTYISQPRTCALWLRHLSWYRQKFVRLL